MCFPYLVQLPCVRAFVVCAFVCVCVCVSGRDTLLHLHSVPSSAGAVCVFLLELCDAASCSVLCHQDCSTVECEREPTARGLAWFWEVAEAYVCLVKKRVWFLTGDRTYLGLF